MRPFLLNRWILGLMALVNILGSIYGFWWYRLQLASSPLWLWPIIPDSPLSSTFFALMCIALLLGVEWDGLILLGCLSAIKYGLWATLINWDYVQMLNAWPTENVMLIFSHLAMAVEGFLYLMLYRYRWSAIFFVAVWFGINDFFDYNVFKVHPYLFADGQLGLARLSILALTLLLIVAAVVLKRKQSIFSSRRIY